MDALTTLFEVVRYVVVYLVIAGAALLFLSGCSAATPGGYIVAFGEAGGAAGIIEQQNMGRLPANVYAQVKTREIERSADGRSRD